MTEPLADISLRKAAIIAGVAIVVMAVAAVVATDITIGKLFVQNNAEATYDNIKASEMLFRTGVLSWLIILICDVFAAWGLYIFLKPVNKSLSLIMAWFRLIYAAILGTALLQFVDVLLLISGDVYQISFGLDLLQSQVLLFLNGFYQKWSIGLVIFGIHVFLLGYMIVRSGYIPKFWGILLIIAAVGYLITNMADLLLPDYENIKKIIEWIFIIPMLGEVGLGFWLLIKGVKVIEELT